MIDMHTPEDKKLTIQEVADRFGLSTSELSELRLANDGLPIERQGFNLYYSLQNVRGFEQYETLKVIQHVLASERPMVMLRHIAGALGLTDLNIAGRQIGKNITEISVGATASPKSTAAGTVRTRTLGEAKKARPLMDDDLHRLGLDGRYVWYVVHTRPRQELIALENLQRQGYSCYLPKIRINKPSASKLVLIDEPMFPRYLFISVDPLFQTKGSSPIRSTRGVHELVRFGLEPAQIAFEILRAIYERESVQLKQPDSPFKTGDRVKVIDGPLAGLESIYQAKTGEERSMILLDLLSRPLKVRVSTAQLRKIG